MKEIHVTTITEAVAGLAVEACCRLPEDMAEAMRAARALELSPVGRNILDGSTNLDDRARMDKIEEAESLSSVVENGLATLGSRSATRRS